MFTPLIVKVVSSEGTRHGVVVESKESEDGVKDMLLQSAVLALCKFMCISAEFCSKHLQVSWKHLYRCPCVAGIGALPGCCASAKNS